MNELFIVYSGEFDTDKPRECMAMPDIIMVTKNEKQATRKLQEIYDSCAKINRLEYLSSLEDEYFEFSSDTEYGCAGIIKQALEEG